jgi:hypothetical protein
MPFRSAIEISISTTSGFNCDANSTAANPPAASAITRIPCCLSNTARMPSRII